MKNINKHILLISFLIFSCWVIFDQRKISNFNTLVLFISLVVCNDKLNDDENSSENKKLKGCILVIQQRLKHDTLFFNEVQEYASVKELSSDIANERIVSFLISNCMVNQNMRKKLILINFLMVINITYLNVKFAIIQYIK